MFRGNSSCTFTYWGQEQRCPVCTPNPPEAVGRSSAAAKHAGPAKSKKKMCGWTGSLNTYEAAHVDSMTAARGACREPGAPLPSFGKRKICFSFSACHENGCAHGWDPTLATNSPIDNWPQGAVSFLSFIRELLSVYDLRFAGLCCAGVIVFLQTHGIMFKSLNTLTPPSGFVFQMTAHYLLNTFYPIFFKIF